MLKRIFKIKRYFIVCYAYSAQNNSHGFGYVTVLNGLGEYPSQQYIFERAKEGVSKSGNIIDSVVITNIMEVSRLDMNNFIKNDHTK